MRVHRQFSTANCKLFQLLRSKTRLKLREANSLGLTEVVRACSKGGVVVGLMLGSAELNSTYAT